MENILSEQRIKHMCGVAQYMYNNAKKYGLNPEQMYVLGLNHDIGYVFGKEHHEIKGGRLFGLNTIYGDCIAGHGLTPKSYAFLHHINEIQIPKEMILLWEADMMVGRDGELIGFDARLQDIGQRNGLDSRVYKNCEETVAWLLKRSGV